MRWINAALDLSILSVISLHRLMPFFCTKWKVKPFTLGWATATKYVIHLKRMTDSQGSMNGWWHNESRLLKRCSFRFRLDYGKSRHSDGDRMIFGVMAMITVVKLSMLESHFRNFFHFITHTLIYIFCFHFCWIRIALFISPSLLLTHLS